MKLDTEFIQLPLRFDVALLQQEVRQFGESDWRLHPQGHKGNTAVPLIAVHGDPANDAVKGPMQPTPLLARSPYLRQVLASFAAPLGRTRLMRIVGNGEATAHVDTNYYWMHHVRIHVPIVTNPQVRFLCGAAEINMPAGQTWLFDTWRRHNVLNAMAEDRIHLVADSVGSARFWELAAAGPAPERYVGFQPNTAVDLELETSNFPVVMSPWEQEWLLTHYVLDLDRTQEGTSQRAAEFERMLRRFLQQWRALWARFGESPDGFPVYQQALKQFQEGLPAFENQLKLVNGMEAVEIVRQALVRPALNPDLALKTPKTVATTTSHPPKTETVPAAARTVPAGPTERFDRPIFIVAAPRSGSTFLFETLSRSPSLWTIGGESHQLFEGIAPLHPANRGWDSNRLTAADAPAVAATLKANFLARLQDRDGKPPAAGTCLRMLEKTPKNSLRIPFLHGVFPDALFIYLFREPQENLSSIMEAWRSGRFVTYKNLPSWTGLPWSLALIPEWRELRGKDLAEIAAAQYESTHRHMLADLAAVPKERWCGITYADLVADPQAQMQRLCAFAGIDWNQDLAGQALPHSRHTLTPPDPNKWKKNAAALEPVLPAVAEISQHCREAVAGVLPKLPMPAPKRESTIQTSEADPNAATTETKTPAAAAVPNAPAAPDGEALRSVYTSNLPGLFNHLGISLLITTYQAGKLIVARADGTQLNTHFRNFPMPMGLACSRNKLALGTKLHVWDFRNQPEVARKLEPAGKHDGCYLPRSTHFTGDIRIHEIAWGGDELWIANTRFSCLCTLDRDHSFVPRWRPPFITAYSPDDRCHLNGLAVIDDRPRYVTCLGATDRGGGWRENKANGGLLLDVDRGETALTGLSMPHSPRWYRNRLWLLESGNGSLAVADLDTGKLDTIVQLPGFTRGLDFVGNLAFIGLSQVRETATFSGLPITERLQERICGVWIVDITSGKTVGFLRFQAAVQEIFAVQVLRGLRFPEVLTDNEEVLAHSFVLPDEALREVAAVTV